MAINPLPNTNMATIHPDRPKQLVSRYLNEEQPNGAGSPTLAVITTGLIPLLAADNTPLGNASVTKFVNNDGTVSAEVTLLFTTTPNAPFMSYASQPAGPQPLLQGLTASFLDFGHTLILGPSFNTSRVANVRISANGSISGIILNASVDVGTGPSSHAFYLRG
jgi:hypothetical protein